MSDGRTPILRINFKEVAGGYVYRESFRWRFWRARHYLVNDDQKAALLDVILPKRPILSQAIMWGTLCLMVAVACVGMRLYSGHHSPTALDILSIIALTVAQVIPAFAIFFWWKRRRLRPLLATLTPTDMRITPDELRAALTNGASTKQTDTPQDDAQQTITRLTSRVERTERELRGLRLAIPVFAILAIVPHLIHLDRPAVVNTKSVIAESFAVKNAGGDIVAQFSAGRDGSPSIVFLDANKKIRLMASVGAIGPSVSLMDPQGVSRATLSLNGKSDPSLTLLNADKVPRSVFAIDTGGSGHLVIYGAAGGLDLAANDGRVRWTPLSGAPVDVLPATK